MDFNNSVFPSIADFCCLFQTEKSETGILCKKLKKSQQVTLYIANRAFSGLRKFIAIYKHRQIVDLAFKND